MRTFSLLILWQHNIWVYNECLIFIERAAPSYSLWSVINKNIFFSHPDAFWQHYRSCVHPRVGPKIWGGSNESDVPTVSPCFCVRHFSVRGQTDACGGRRRYPRFRRRGADRDVPAQRPVRPKPAAPDSFHARAAVPAGAGVREGELCLQTPALRACHGAQLTGDNDKGTVVIRQWAKGCWHFMIELFLLMNSMMS